MESTKTADPRAARPVELDLVREELRDLTTDLVDTSSPAPFGTYAFRGDEPGAELGRHIERVVFQEFFGNSPQLLAEEYARYEESSVFFCVVDHKRRLPAGTMRVILPSDAGFKTFHDLERIWETPAPEALASSALELDLDRVWDVATLAVDGEYRGAATQGLVSMGLYQALATSALRTDAAWWITVLDLVVLDLLQTQFHDPFRYFRGVEPMRYLDSPSSVPVWCEIGPWAERMAGGDQSMYEIVCQGRGLEAAVATPDWDRVAEMAGGRTIVGAQPTSVSASGITSPRS